MNFRIYFYLLTLVVGALIGTTIVHFKLFPYPALIQVKNTLEDLSANHQAFLGNAPVNQLIPNEKEGDGVISLVPDLVAPGNTLLAGVNGNSVALWLINPEGQTLREWVPPTSEILANAEHLEGVELPYNDFFVTLHGAVLMPDGGPLFTIANYVLIKMSACGEVDWVVPTMAHHSVYASYDDTYWSATRFYHETDNEKQPQFRAPYWEDAIIQIDSSGEIIQTISMIDVIEKNQLWGAIFGGQLPTPETDGDVLHLNDVEILSPEYEDAFPNLDAGDIMVSLRNPNLVIIFDPETLEAKWIKSGPWIRQHDPDFTSDGRIAVLDNRNDGALGRQFGGSRVIMIKPTTLTGGDWEAVYENSQKTPFFTAKRGLLDLPGNGNIIVTESEAGRVFEIDPQGDIVWEYINRYDDKNTASVMHAERYPAAFAEKNYAKCS